MQTLDDSLRSVSNEQPNQSAKQAFSQYPKSSEDNDGSPVAELDQLVTVERLREIIWDKASRPSIQWLRKETKSRMLPHVRRGRLIFYRPRYVIDWYAQRESRPSSVK